MEKENRVIFLCNEVIIIDGKKVMASVYHVRTWTDALFYIAESYFSGIRHCIYSHKEVSTGIEIICI